MMIFQYHASKVSFKSQGTKKVFKSQHEPGTAVYIFNSRTQKAEADASPYEASSVYTVRP